MRFCSFVAAASLFVAVAGTSHHVFGATITFEGENGVFMSARNQSFSDSGFQFTQTSNSGFALVSNGQQSDVPSNGTTTLRLANTGESIVITSAAGTPFSLMQFDAAAFFTGQVLELDLVGDVATGGTVVDNLLVSSPASGGFVTYLVAGFDNVIDVRVNVGSFNNAAQLDNVVLNAATVPEPQSVLLVLGALLSLRLVRQGGRAR